MRDKPLILIVDDEKDFADIVKTKLHSAGFDTVSADNADEAVKSAVRYMPDLILMDIFMGSGASGTDAALLIKHHPETKNLKIAFLSSLKDPWPGLTGNNEAVSQELGMENFLDKTEDLNTLVGKIKEILTKQGQLQSPLEKHS